MVIIVLEQTFLPFRYLAYGQFRYFGEMMGSIEPKPLVRSHGLVFNRHVQLQPHCLSLSVTIDTNPSCIILMPSLVGLSITLVRRRHSDISWLSAQHGAEARW